MIFTLPITNYGETPANEIDICVDSGSPPEEMITSLRAKELLKRNAIFPHDTWGQLVDIKWEDRNKILAGDSVYVAGRVTYSDNLGRRWVTEATYEIRGLSSITTVHVGVPELISYPSRRSILEHWRLGSR
jgi:hypothetical protein